MRGADKLLQSVDGIPILRRAACTALDANLGPVLVGLRPDDMDRHDALKGLDLCIVPVPDADDGMAETLRKGSEETQSLITQTNADIAGLMILLPDMPEVEKTDLIKLGDAFSASIGMTIRATT